MIVLDFNATKGSLNRIGKEYYSPTEHLQMLMRCYCGRVCETESELKSHIIKVHGARNGDWRTWLGE